MVAQPTRSGKPGKRTRLALLAGRGVMGADSAARRLRAATVVLAAQVALAATAPTRGEKADEHEERHQGKAAKVREKL